MTENHDFSSTEHSKPILSTTEVQWPIFLEKDVIQYLDEKCQESEETLHALVNRLLRIAMKYESAATS